MPLESGSGDSYDAKPDDVIIVPTMLHDGTAKVVK